MIHITYTILIVIAFVIGRLYDRSSMLPVTKAKDDQIKDLSDKKDEMFLESGRAKFYYQLELDKKRKEIEKATDRNLYLEHIVRKMGLGPVKS